MPFQLWRKMTPFIEILDFRIMHAMSIFISGELRFTNISWMENSSVKNFLFSTSLVSWLAKLQGFQTVLPIILIEWKTLWALTWNNKKIFVSRKY